MNDVKGSLIKSKNTLSRHTQGRLRTSGACQNLVKTKTYSMLVASDSLSSAIAGKLVPDIFDRLYPYRRPALPYYCTSLYISRDISSILQVVFTSMTEYMLDKRLLKFSASILLISSFTMSGISLAQAASDDFGRLFTTPEERRKLQTLRFAEPELKIIEEVEIPVVLAEEVDEEIEQRDIEGITLNGLVYRKGSKSTVWLNGTNSYEGSLASEYFRINAGDINSEKVSVTVPEVGLEFDLKVGQTYEPNDGSLLDIVEDDMPFTIK